MQKCSSRTVDRELRSILAYLHGASPSRQLTAERLLRLAALVLGRNEISYPEALEMFGLPPGATPSSDEVNQLFRQLSRKMHPDAGGDTATFQRLNNAKERLLEEPQGTSIDDLDHEDRVSKAGLEALHEAMKPLGKKPHWWIPSHNFCLNQALFGWNGWYFTILPFRPDMRAYRPAQYGRPEGIVLHPSWNSVRGAEWSQMSPDVVERLVGVAKKQKTIKESAKHEIHWIETKFGIKVPPAVESAILKKIDAVAVRRIDVNRLRTKDELWPFDGGKPIPL